MASNRFLIVPEDSSAARMPLPGVTMARATLLRSARFIGAFSSAISCQSRCGPNPCNSKSVQVKVDGSRAIPKNLPGNLAEKIPQETGPAGGRRRLGRFRLGDLRIEFALDVALGHPGGGQH